MKIDLFVGLKIPDTTAITTLHTIEKMGYKELKKVKRELYYSFEIEGNEQEFINKISKIDILVNANKNNFRTKVKEEENASTILVQDIDDNCLGLLSTLKEKLGLKEIKSMEKGVLWTLYFDKKNKDIAIKITKDLLVNDNYQKACVKWGGKLKVLIIFGSKSDEKVYGNLIKTIRTSNIEYYFRICSAHKTPDLLDEILNKEYDLILAGAGLAAHLPGVIASKTITPIIGIPCTGAFNGLDAFLSIVQMPPGFPVLCSPVNAEKLIDLNIFTKAYVSINIIGSKENKRVKQCTELLDRFNISYEFSEELNKTKVNLYFFDLNNYKKMKFDTQYLVLNIPLSENSNEKDTIKLIKLVNKGLWIGLNNLNISLMT